MKIKKIVLTGGPCGGKSSALTRIGEVFSNRGWRVLFISESATELISGGISPTTCSSNEDFQTHILELQLEKEKLYKSVAEKMPVEKLLIVCDRGALDNKVYMTDEEFKKVLLANNITEEEIKKGYDAVFHLETAAKGALPFYTLSNNKARRESPEEAIKLDDDLINAWAGHDYHIIIDNSTNFKNKIKRLIHEIGIFLGEPEIFDTERKFLIEMPDESFLKSRTNYQEMEILQTFLLTAYPDEERCVRRLDLNGQVLYMHRLRKLEDGEQRSFFETLISKDDYLSFLSQADPSKKTIAKIRLSFVYEKQYFEVDIFSFWNDKAILRIEPLDKTAPLKLPDELRPIKEVTGEEIYTSAYLASIHSNSV